MVDHTSRGIILSILLYCGVVGICCFLEKCVLISSTVLLYVLRGI